MTWQRDALAEVDETIVCADGFDEAIVGYGERCGQPVVAVYDVEACVELLVKRDGMSPEDAREYLEFNCIGAWIGDEGPMWLHKVEKPE